LPTVAGADAGVVAFSDEGSTVERDNVELLTGLIRFVGAADIWRETITGITPGLAETFSPPKKQPPAVPARGGPARMPLKADVGTPVLLQCGAWLSPEDRIRLLRRWFSARNRKNHRSAFRDFCNKICHEATWMRGARRVLGHERGQ
jgi:hypothetical protein